MAILLNLGKSRMYFTQMTEYANMRDHLITCVDSVIRIHPECGVIITGDFIQMSDSFLKQKCTQYPAIHTNYSLPNCTISDKKDFNRSSDFLLSN